MFESDLKYSILLHKLRHVDCDCGDNSVNFYFCRNNMLTKEFLKPPLPIK